MSGPGGPDGPERPEGLSREEERALSDEPPPADRRRRILAGVGAVVLLVGLAVLGFVIVRDGDDHEEPADPGQPVEQPDDDTPTTSAPADPDASGANVPLDQVDVGVVEIGQFDSPMALENRVDDRALYVALREGQVVRVNVEGEGANRSYSPDPAPILDLSDDVVTEGEQGLLDIEFSPDGATLYVHYSQAPNGDTQIDSFAYDGSEIDVSSRREILSVEQFRANHNGGSIEFGPDGYLYIGLGDGGGGGDPEENGQDTEALLGKILRIDPEGAGGSEPYAIPEDNPFADGDGGAPEVFAYGLRNPWRLSFDPATGDLWIGDVGQNAWEEIDHLPASDGGGRGANLGWNEMEASHSFEGGSNPPGGVLPVFEYPNPDSGCSVSGGVVYRGSEIPDLVGAYLFGDFCESRLRALRLEGGEVVDARTFDVRVGQGLVSFGRDNVGEVYLVALDGPVYLLTPGGRG